MRAPVAITCREYPANHLTRLMQCALVRCRPQISPNIGDYDGRTALHLSACEGNSKLVEFILLPMNKGDPKVRHDPTLLRTVGPSNSKADSQSHRLLIAGTSRLSSTPSSTGKR